MEAPPPDSAEDDKKESSTKKKKSAEAIGAFIIEPKKEAAPESQDKAESIFDRLLGKQDKTSEKQKSPEQDAEDKDEKDSPLESLSAEEKQHVEAELLSGDGNVHSPESDPTLSELEQAAAIAAVEIFRQKITEEGQDSDQALQETLAEIIPEESDEKEPSAESTFDESESENIELAPENSSAAPQDFEEVIDLRTSEPILTPKISRAETPESKLFEQQENQPLRTSTATRERKNYEAERSDVPAFVAGGLIGYLLGRRRGRIKTEKRLIPIQQKLEEQVKKLKSELIAKEATIRKTAVEQVRKNPKSNLAEKIRAPKFYAEKSKIRSEQTAVIPVPLERIGRVVISAETEKTATKKSELAAGIDQKDVITMSRAELLAVSEKIIIEGSSLRQIYETNLVGEKAVRRLVSEYLRGGDVQKALRKELVEKEIDFERDPILRDKGDYGARGGGADRLSELLTSAGIKTESERIHASVVKSEKAAKKVEAKRKQQRKMVDVTLSVVIAVLVGIIITLLITRHKL